MSGTSRSEQAAATREKLLVAAKSLFAEKGYHGTPVRSINRSINMGDGILYHYFPGGKREILNVLIRESFERRREMIGYTHRTVENLELREALLTFIRKLFALFVADIDLITILLREKDVLELDEAKLLTALVEEQASVITSFLNHRRENGELRKNLDVTLAARQFLTMAMQPGLSIITGLQIFNEPDVDKYFEKMVDFTIDLWKNP